MMSLQTLAQRATMPQFALNGLICLMGAALIAVLSQITIPLPFTPVPITGQTFGVTLLALLCGRKLGTGIVVTYLLAGAVGLPVFAGAQAGLVVGPTMGYLVGMLLAAVVMGSLSDRGWTKSFGKSIAAACMGSLLVFGCGLTVLAFFIPTNMLLMAGLVPFLPGLLIKDFSAAFIAYQTHKKSR